jgi:hypothetical protein
LARSPAAYAAPRDALRALVAALDAYAWALNKGVVTVPELFGTAAASSSGSKKRKGSSEGDSSSSHGGGGVRILEAIADFADRTLREVHGAAAAPTLTPPPPSSSDNGGGSSCAVTSSDSSGAVEYMSASDLAAQAAELAELRAMVRTPLVFETQASSREGLGVPSVTRLGTFRWQLAVCSCLRATLYRQNPVCLNDPQALRRAAGLLATLAVDPVGAAAAARTGAWGPPLQELLVRALVALPSSIHPNAVLPLASDDCAEVRRGCGRY